MDRNSRGFRDRHHLRRSLTGTWLLGAVSFLVPCLHAADGIWIQPTSGNLWSIPANWQGGTIADGAGFFANFTNDITGDITVRLDTPRTIGNLVFGDSSIATPGGWILDNNGSITNVLTLAGTTPTITVNALAAGRAATISLALAGTSGLRKDGPGTLVLAGANTYTGTTAVTAGILRLTNSSALGGSATVAMTSGAQLELSGGLTFGSGSTITINGSGGANFAGSLQSASGVNVWAGNVVIGSSGSRIGAQTGATLNVSGVISGTAGFNLTVRNVDQTGTTILSGPNTYNGSTTVLGRLSVAQIGSVGSLSSNLGAPTTAANAQINLGLQANTATLIYTGSGETTDRVVRINSNDTSGATIDHSGTGLLRFTSNLVLDPTAATRTLTLQGSTLGTGEIAGLIPDAGLSAITSLTKAGTGTWILSGANTYSGVTALNGGVLNATTLANINSNSAIGRGSVAGSAADLVFGGGTLQYTTAAAASTNRLFTLGNASGLTGTLDSSAASAAHTMSFTGTGSIAFGGLGARTLTLTGSNAGNNTFAPVVGDGTGGSTSLLKTGAGTWILAGANSYTGTTTVGSANGANAGTLQLSGSGQLGSGAVTVFGGTLDLNGTTQTVSTLTLGGGASGSTATVSIGSGDLRLGGNVTFNNANNPNGALISSTTGFLSLLGNRTFTVGDSTAVEDLTISAIIRDGDGTPRSLTKSGTGVLYLSGANTYSGGTIVSQGAGTRGLVLLANNAIGSGPLIIGDANTTGNGARFSLNGYNQTVSALSSGATAFTRVIEAGGSTGGAVSTLTVDQATNTTYNGFIRDQSGASGQLAIVKTGVGFLDFSGAQASQNYSGGLTVNGGTLGFAAAANLGTGTITLGGGTLRYTPTGTTSLPVSNASIILTNATSSSIEITDAGGTVTALGAVSGGGSLNKTGAGRLTLSNGTSSYSGGTTISGGILNFSNVAALGSGAVTFAADSTLEAGVGGTLANAIVINSTVTGTFNTQGNNVLASGIVSGNGTLAKQGTGRLTLSNGGNDYTGGTTINAGILNYSHVDALGTGAVSFAASSTLESGVAGILANDIEIEIGVIATVDTLTITATFSGEITGEGEILKKGAGILYLSGGNNSFSGGLVVENASTSGIPVQVALGVVLLADNAAGTGPLTIGNASTSTARFSLNGYDQTVSALSSGSVGIRVLEANGTAGGAVSTLTVDQDTDTSYSGFLRDTNSGGGQLALVKSGSGLLDLSGAQTASTYSGGLTVNEGTIGFANATNIGSGAVTLGGGTLRYTPTGTTALTIPNASISLTASTVSTIEVTDAGGTLTSSGIISGLGDLNKTGAGTLILTNANTYDGQTGVTEGTLIINGNQSGADGNVTVSAGATLGGNGTIGGDTTISGDLRVGSNAAAGTTGSLGFSGENLSFESGSTWFIDIVGGASDSVTGIGTFSIDPAATLSFNFSGPTQQSYTLASYTNRANANTFSGFEDGHIFSGYQINYTSTAITLTAIPEPGTVGLLGLLLGGLFYRGIRARRQRTVADAS